MWLGLIFFRQVTGNDEPSRFHQLGLPAHPWIGDQAVAQADHADMAAYGIGHEHNSAIFYGPGNGENGFWLLSSGLLLVCSSGLRDKEGFCFFAGCSC